MDTAYDVGIAGAGILGLAHAYHLAKRGLRVVVFERNARAHGASIRNFGMIWPIGQPAGTMHRMALRSRELWLEVLQESGLWHEQTGSLHLAYREDEAQVLREFVPQAGNAGFDVTLLGPQEVLQRSKAVKPQGLLAGVWSPSEVCVDPREVIASLPDFLHRRYGVTFVYQCQVTGYDAPILEAGGQSWRVEHLYACCGDASETLFPNAFRDSGILRCKLQMMRTAPVADGWRLGPMLAGGLTLRHYRSFEGCPTLPALKKRVHAEMPLFDAYGIHVMASQNGRGELVLGDSHEYNEAIDPFDKEEIDRLILDYLQTFLQVPQIQIASRWHGIYVKHPTEPYSVGHPAPAATLVTNVGGAGMTLSFGLAEQVCLNHGKTFV